MSEILDPERTQNSLWIGDLPSWVEENFLFNLFVSTNQLLSVKLIRNKNTGLSEGYGFLEFRTHEGAATILQTYNGHPIPGTDVVFRLNWAAYGVGKAQPSGDDHSLFVGDLAPDVTDLILQEYFRQFYPSVRSAKVITDATTGRSKGYGFVRFGSEPERDQALTDMNGHYLSNRPIRVSLATAKKSTATAAIAQAPHPSDFDPTNTTLFIGGLSPSISEDQLRALFGRFGDIIYVKIPQGKGCGFVQFVLRTSAERAITTMNGTNLGGSNIRISWGRSSSRAANQGGPLGPYGAMPGGFPPGAFPGGGFAPDAFMAGPGGAFPAGILPGMLPEMAFVQGFGGPNGAPAGDLYNVYQQAGLLPPQNGSLASSGSHMSGNFDNNAAIAAAAVQHHHRQQQQHYQQNNHQQQHRPATTSPPAVADTSVTAPVKVPSPVADTSVQDHHSGSGTNLSSSLPTKGGDSPLSPGHVANGTGNGDGPRSIDVASISSEKATATATTPTANGAASNGAAVKNGLGVLGAHLFASLLA